MQTPRIRYFSRKKMKPFLLSLLTVASLTAGAQSPLTPSEKAFEKKWIKNETYTMTWYALKDTLKFEMGKVTTERSAANDQLSIVTRVALKNMKAPWVDSTVALLKTLQPLRHASYNMQRDMVLDFGKTVTGYYLDKMKKINTVISDTPQHDYFDSNLYPVLLGWLPLKDGYQRDIAIYDYNPAARTGVLKASVQKVTSGLYLSDKSGERAVWVVTVSDEIGNGVSTYYFDKADRRLWQQDITTGGRRMLMKRVE